MIETEMHATTESACYHGLRMTADEFFALPEDGAWYELIDGVVVMSPSPTPVHQDVAMEIAFQLRSHLRSSPVGKVLMETDIHLGQGPTGKDVVYRPDIVFYSNERLAGLSRRLVGPPDLVVEVISPSSRLLDWRTKRDDFERCGVREYWIIDPQTRTFTFLALDRGRFIEFLPEGDTLTSRAIAGFRLELGKVTEIMAQWQ